MKITFIKKISAVSIAFFMLLSLTVPALANENGEVAPDKERSTDLKSEADESKQEVNDDTGQEENGRSNQEENDKSNQEVNGDTGQEESGGSNQEANDKSNKEVNGGTGHEENGGSNQEENDKSNQEVKGDTGQEENGGSNQAANDDSNKEDKDAIEGTKENANKSTEIHLHLKNCVAPVERVFVKLNGEWEEMSNPGNSSLYKLKDDGEFSKDDITEFKLVFESGAERVYKIESIRVGVEAEGSINYWVDDCAVPEDDHTEIPGDGTGDDNEGSNQGGESPDVTEIVKELYINFNLDIEKVVNLTLLIDGEEKIELIKVNNLWKLIFANGLDVTDIKGIELEFEDGTTKFIALSLLSFELKDQVIHLEIDEAVLGTDNETDADVDEETGKTDSKDNNSGGDDKQDWSGKVLPKTGESSKMMFYIVGFLLMAAGGGLRRKKPIRN